MKPVGLIWIYMFLHCVKRHIEAVLCIWVANYGMICRSSCKILRILNHLKIITECIDVSLAHDRIDIKAFGNQSVSVWGNDNFLTTSKFYYVYGYGFLYFIRHGMKPHLMLYMCHYFAWFVFIYWKLSICFTFIYYRMVRQFNFIRLSLIVSLYAVGITDGVLCWLSRDHVYELCYCIWQDLV